VKKSVLFLCLISAVAISQQADYSALKWRSIGPFRAGRVSAVAGVPTEPMTYYIGTPGGGVWKTTDAGQVWTPRRLRSSGENRASARLACRGSRSTVVTVSAARNAGNPHYLPTASVHDAIGAEELVLLDLWGKLDEPGAVFADITWMGFTGPRAPERHVKAFEAVSAARDAAISLVQRSVSAGQDLRGYQVDRAASAVLEAGLLDLKQLPFIRAVRKGMKAAGIDTQKIVTAGMVAFMEGAMLYGVFHGDLHGGNLLVLADGRVGLREGRPGLVLRGVPDGALTEWCSSTATRPSSSSS